MFKRINQSLKNLTVVLVTLMLLAGLMVPVLALGSESGDIDFSKTREKIKPSLGDTVNDFENNHNPNALKIEVNDGTSFGSPIVFSNLGSSKKGSLTVTLVRGQGTTYVADWSAKEISVKAFYVKGGNAYHIYNYENSNLTADGLLVSPPKNKGIPEISHVTIVIADPKTNGSEETRPSETSEQTHATKPSVKETEPSKPSEKETEPSKPEESKPTSPTTTVTSSPTTTVTSSPTTTETIELDDDTIPQVGPTSSSSNAPTTTPVATIDLGDEEIPKTGEGGFELSVVGVTFMALVVALTVFKRRLTRQN